MTKKVAGKVKLSGGVNLAVNRREILTLAALLALVFILPLAVVRFSADAWRELSWRNAVDIAFLEWTAGFLNIFLFLLLLEQSRISRRLSFSFIACGFLAMGGMDFIYSMSGPGSETAMWIKFFGLLFGAFVFCLSMPAAQREESDFIKVILHNVLPILLLVPVLAWIPHAIPQLLPSLLSPQGGVSLFGSLFLLLPAALFFLASLPWLRIYLREGGREALLVALLMLIYAQLVLFIRVSRVWGVMWWGWHIGLALVVLLASILLLLISVHRTVVWKLIFSLGLTFGLTVLLASGIIQSYSQKRYMENIQRELHLLHRQRLLDYSLDLQTAIDFLSSIQRDANLELAKRHGGFPASGAPVWLIQLLDEYRSGWGKRWFDSGFVTRHGERLQSNREETGGSESDGLSPALAEIKNQAEQVKDGSFFTGSFFLDEESGVSRIILAMPLLVRGEREGFFFCELELDSLRSGSLLKKQRMTDFEGKILFDTRSGRSFYVQLPRELTESPAWSPQAGENLVRSLKAVSIDIGAHGKIIVAALFGKTYFVSSQKIPGTSWVAMHLVDRDALPSLGGRSKYFFAAVGMVTLLWGFVILLLLLNFQLARPLRHLLTATERVEHGDLHSRIRLHETTELGTLSRSFDSMLDRLEELYIDLENTIKERTTALDEARLANQAKVSFFANISHELRTPLHGILSCSRLGLQAENQGKQGKSEEYFENIQCSGERLSRMINEILDLAKLESGNMEFTFGPVDLYLIAQQVKEELLGLFKEKEIEFICPLPAEKAVAIADREMLQRVFRNIIGNALKFSPAGSAIRVEFCSEAQSITVSIQDEGPGIPDDNLERIFDKFFQGAPDTGRGGTGIGLSTCKEIILAHGGSIRAVNREAGGTVFVFELPVKRQNINHKNSG